MPTSTDKIFSLEDVQSVLADFFASELSQAKQQGGGVTQYVGARYVPLFANPIEWDSARAYEPLTIVLHKGNSYTSRQSVPTGIDISDDAFWAMTGNYNAQIEQYRSEVTTFSDRITQNESAIAEETKRAKAAEAAEEQRATAAEATKAPVNHASEETVYGVGNAVNYGHLRLADNGASDANAGIAASPKYVTDVKAELTGKLRGYYTKGESDERFAPKAVEGIIGCVGDSILAGWSDEHPSSIDAWDVYLADALGVSRSNVYKVAIGGSGFDSNTTIAQEMNTLKTNITSAGRKLTDVSMIVIGAGVNDVANAKTQSGVRSGAQSAVKAALQSFPNATVHVFPMITGYNWLGARMLELESAINEGAMAASNKNGRVVTHTGCWSWCYDGIDEGVSRDTTHLLAGGLKRVGDSMAVEIKGGSAYREGYSFEVTNAQGAKVATGHRRGSMVYFKLATNLTTIKVSSDNAALGMPPRYLSTTGCLTFSAPDEDRNIIMFMDPAKGFVNSYNALSNLGVYGTACYAIDDTVK